MRVKVICAFSDKYTDVFNTIGTVLDVSDDRGTELLKAGVVEKIDEPVEKPTKKPKKA